MLKNKSIQLQLCRGNL